MEKNCVFCDPANFKENLIAETRDFYITATLGQITEGGYVLIIPIKHIPCMGALEPRQIDPAALTIKDACRALTIEYRRQKLSLPYPVTIFEHGIVGQTIRHAHFHIFPAVIDLAPRIGRDFPGSEIVDLPFGALPREFYKNRPQPYLFWTAPNGQPMICRNPPAPAQYLRLVTAEILGVPERGNWREMNPELDKKLRLETVTRLRPYFPVLREGPRPDTLSTGILAEE